MTRGLTQVSQSDFSAALEEVVLPDLVEVLSSRGPGHCMRVTDLDRELMVRLCGALRSRCPHAMVVILADDQLRTEAPELAVSSTKLVELRNPLPNGEQRAPLMVFVPNNLRASAEDSFGVATFEDVPVHEVYDKLRERLLKSVPQPLQAPLEAALRTLRDEAWPYADGASIARLLLTAKRNDFEPEAIGAALFEVGLVPDFAWLNNPDECVPRLNRNIECVATVTSSTRTERTRALELGLDDSAFCKRLGEFFAASPMGHPKQWTHKIVADSVNWPLAFNHWPFEDGGIVPDAVYIGPVDLPDVATVPDDTTDARLIDLVGQKVLSVTKTGQKKFSVTFHVDPVPSKIQGLDRFVAEVISRDNGPTGLRRRKKTWVQARASATVTFTGLNKVDWEEGWYFVRVYAETGDGERVPLLDGTGQRLPRVQTPEDEAPNQSGLFYVLTDEEVDIDPPQRAVPREQSVTHALYKAKFSAVTQGSDPARIQVEERQWVERQGRLHVGGVEALEFRVGREGRSSVLVCSVLAETERTFLSDPSVGQLRMDVSASGAISRTLVPFSWPESDEARRFLDARAAYFAAVLQGDHRFVTQTVDLTGVREQAVAYGGSYLAWLSAALSKASSGDEAVARLAFDELRLLLSMDTVSLLIRDHRGKQRDAILLGPTHPLRVLWLATWAATAADWLDRAGRSDKEFVVPTRDALLNQLAPSGIPPVVMSKELGRSYISVDNINPYWSVYGSNDERDPRGLLGDICQALGVAEPPIGGSGINASYIASRLQRYLIQHPYVKTLTINAFNAGRGTALADVLLEMQVEPAFEDLRYDIRLFAIDAEAPGLGDALVELLSPDSAVMAREADAFSTPTESHLHPKLRLAIRAVDHFRQAPESHPAHVTFLFDQFPTEEIRAEDAGPLDDCSFVHGLIQPSAVDYRELDDLILWSRRPLHGVAKPIPNFEELSDMLSQATRLTSVAAASAARNRYLPNARPVVLLSLKADDRALLHQVHEFSDWVLTIDRNLGIEFFDHRRHRTRPDYLIDHSPDFANALGHRLAITSRSVTELEALLAPILMDYGLPSGPKHAVSLLEQLRSLSGRLALKLLSSPTQRAEALGLALSRLYLEHQQVFENQIVVPLDAHLDLYRPLKKAADELGDEVSFRRTDLALFDLDPQRRQVVCRLVEVKCYKSAGGLSAYEQLKTSIAEQVAQSEFVLAYHFDPHRQAVDRPDRSMKNRDFAALLEFYLDRSVRYGLVAPDAADEARYFLRTLDKQDYHLQFTRSALIFDFSKAGTGAVAEGGIEYHRIGFDLIAQLVESAVRDNESVAATYAAAPTDAHAEMSQELARRRSAATGVPTLESAAFISPRRERTWVWETLHGATATSAPPPTDAPWTAVVGREPSPPSLVAPASEAPRHEQDPISAKPEIAQLPPTVAPQVGTRLEASTLSSAPLPQSDIGIAGISSDASAVQGVPFDVMLGAGSDSPQFGLLGEFNGRKIALDLNQTHTISLFGVQGGGKSYTLGTIAEMASLRVPNVNVLPHPLATVIFHYSPTMDYKPEFTSMVAPNSDEAQVKALREQYGAEPTALSDVLLLVPADKLAERQAEYPSIKVLPLQFGPKELKAAHWKFLMGAVGSQATYIRQVMRIMKGMRDDVTLQALRTGIDASSIPDHLKDLARTRLDFASDYIADGASISDTVRPGRLIIVDVRDEFIEKDEALGLFVVMLQLFADAKMSGQPFNKLVVFDEAHKYIESPDLVAGLVEVVREMRHKGVSILVASQDPPSVPVSLIELSSQVILHKFNSPAWLKHIQKANAALANLTPERMAGLKAGEAFVWSSKATDDSFSQGAMKIRCRPRVTQHGGATKSAVSEIGSASSS
jgi:DNA phosphorothioation-dependent restriction protein DptH